MKLVITMSRRFGTGASVIANELSKRLDIPVYDKAYIEQKLGENAYENEAEAIRKLAESPCIILGRCASDILKDVYKRQLQKNFPLIVRLIPLRPP